MKQTLTSITVCFLLSATSGVLGQGDEAGVGAAELWPNPPYEIAGGESDILPVIDDDATLSDFLAYAAIRNPGLESAFNRWRAAVEGVPQAKALPDPKLTYAYFIEAVETRVGPQRQKLGIAQMFPWFGTLKLRGEVASEAARVAFEEYQAVKLSLFFEVKQFYYEYYYLHRAISITEDNIQLLEDLERVARSKHRAGAPQAGVIKAQVELGKLDDRVRSLADLREPIAARLNAALSRDRDLPISWPRTAPSTDAVQISEDLFERLPKGNPQLRALDGMVAKEQRAIALAKKDYYPRFVAGVDYIDTDEALMAGTPDSGKDPIMAKIALDIPIWRGKYKAGVREAQRRRDAAEQARDHKENVLEADMKMALFRFRDAERKLDLYGDTLVPQAVQSLRVTEEAYRAGAMDFLNLIDAQRLLLEFQLARERALADREIALAEVEALVGAPLKTDIAQ